MINTFGVSFERNYLSTDLLGAGWSLTNDDGYSYAAESGWKTWQEPIEFLRSWLDNRNQWLCEQWKIDMDTAYEQSKPVEPETEPPTTEAPTTTQEPTTEVPTQAPTTQEPTTNEEEPSTTVANNVTAGAKKLSRAKIKSAKNVKKKSVIIKNRVTFMCI